jgi:hypothetical protein
MRIMKLRGALVIALLPLFFLAEEGISAEPPKPQTFSAGRVDQVFAQTTSDSIRVGGWDPASDKAVLAQVTFSLESTSLLIVTFSATGATVPRSSDQSPNQLVTQPEIACTVDDTTPCQRGRGTAAFLLGHLWDSRSFTWIVPGVGKGKHTISIGASWLPPRPGPFGTFFDRTLVVAAAKL